MTFNRREGRDRDAIGTIAVAWPEFHPPGQHGQQPDRLYPRGISQAVYQEKSRR